MSEIFLKPSLRACATAWKMYVDGKDNLAIAEYLGLGEDAWRVYRYLNLHIKANINPEAGDGERQFVLIWQRFNSQYEKCLEEIDAIDRDIAVCESVRDVAALRRVKVSLIAQMGVITKNLQSLCGLDTINIRLFTDVEQEKENTIDYSQKSTEELMQLMGEKLSQ